MSRSLLAISLLMALLALALGVPAVVQADVGGDVVTNLKKALKKGTTEEQVKAVNDVGALRGHLNTRQTNESYRTIRKALPDVESEVRRVMVKALARLRNKNALILVINTSKNDPDVKVRKAARMAILAGRTVFLDTLKVLYEEDENAAFRAELLLLLRDRRKPDAIPFLLTTFGDKEPMVISAAAEALEAITGAYHGYNAGAWKAWHTKWLAERPKTNGDAGTVAPDEGPVNEPPPHVTRSLHPSFYGLKLTSKDVVFVVDISGSVGSGGVDKAKRELVKAVELLGSDVQIGAVFFAEKVELWQEGRMVAATPENKEKLALYLRSLVPGRRTDVYSAFNAGLRIVQRRVEEKKAKGETLREAAALIAVSDGQDNMGKTPIDRIEEKLDRLDLENSVVHAVVLGGKHSGLMHLLAKYGGGEYIVVP